MRGNQRDIVKCGLPLCIDRDTETDLVARRNILMGLWTAKVLGLPVENHAAYAWSVHFADFEEPGDEDVLAKLSADMKRSGVQVSYKHLRRELKENELRAFFARERKGTSAREILASRGELSRGLKHGACPTRIERGRNHPAVPSQHRATEEVARGCQPWTPFTTFRTEFPAHVSRRSSARTAIAAVHPGRHRICTSERD